MWSSGDSPATCWRATTMPSRAFAAAREVPAEAGTTPEPWDRGGGRDRHPQRRWFCPLWFDWPAYRPGQPQAPSCPAAGGAPWTLGPPPEARALPASRGDWPPDAIENFEERAALIEHLGGPRPSASPRSACAWRRSARGAHGPVRSPREVRRDPSSPWSASCRNLPGRGEAQPGYPHREGDRRPGGGMGLPRVFGAVRPEGVTDHPL